jgi:hypothetical protein
VGNQAIDHVVLLYNKENDTHEPMVVWEDKVSGFVENYA